MFLFGQTLIRSDSFHPKTKCSLISIFARKNTLIPRKYNENIFVVVKELVGQFQTMPTFVENILNGGLEWMEWWWWLFFLASGHVSHVLFSGDILMSCRYNSIFQYRKYTKRHKRTRGGIRVLEHAKGFNNLTTFSEGEREN